MTKQSSEARESVRDRPATTEDRASAILSRYIRAYVNDEALGDPEFDQISCFSGLGAYLARVLSESALLR